MDAETPYVDLERQGWKKIEDEGFVELVGPIWRRFDDDGLVFGFMPEARHHNRRGIVQGGMIMTLLDKCLGTAVREANGNQPQSTVQLDVHFVDAAQIGEFLEARATVMRISRYIAFVEGKLTAEGRVVATAKGIWKITNKPSGVKG